MRLADNLPEIITNMKFTVKGPFNNNIYNLMRNIGYRFVGKSETTGEINFVRPVGENRFPRFHIYLIFNQSALEILFDLHLDQKAPIYEGSTAHSGDYSGDAVDTEAERIKHLLQYEIIDRSRRSND
jgi:hypothetical protein